MKPRRLTGFLLGSTILAAFLLVTSSPARAHCDGMDGPVVKSAQAALERGNVNLVLVWVQAGDEREIRAAFAQTLAVRKLGPQAKELADRYFFETLVRVHRAGEGAPFTGLKPAGRDLGPAIPAADRALEAGDPGPLLRLLDTSMQDGVRKRFHDAVAAKSHRPDDVEAGRRYIAHYVTFIHYVERLYEDAMHSPGGHAPEDTETATKARGQDAH